MTNFEKDFLYFLKDKTKFQYIMRDTDQTLWALPKPKAFKSDDGAICLKDITGLNLTKEICVPRASYSIKLLVKKVTGNN